MLPRYGDTRGMDHVRLDPARIQPTRQPEAIAAKKPFRTRFQLLLRLTLNAGKHPGNQPAQDDLREGQGWLCRRWELGPVFAPPPAAA
jgi:hypothetical protein